MDGRLFAVQIVVDKHAENIALVENFNARLSFPQIFTGFF